MSGKALSVLLLTVLLLCLTTLVVSAHGVVVVRSEPESNAVLGQAPNQIAVMFNEEVDTKGSSLQVFRADGTQVDVGDGGVDLTDPDHASMLVHLPALPDAAYVVHWRVVLEDGDASDGFLTFTIGAAAAGAAAVALPTVRTIPVGGTFWLATGSGMLVLLAVMGLWWRRRLA